MATRIEITTAARRISRLLNTRAGQGGFCVFSADGRGGEFYTEGSLPEMSGLIKMWVPNRRTTVREVQEDLDNRRTIARQVQEDLERAEY